MEGDVERDDDDETDEQEGEICFFWRADEEDDGAVDQAGGVNGADDEVEPGYAAGDAAAKGRTVGDDDGFVGAFVEDLVVFSA